MHGTELGKYSLSFGELLRTEISRKKTSSLVVRKIYLNIRGLSSYDLADHRKRLAACVEARAQRNVRPAKKHSSLGDGVVRSARAAERSPWLLTLKDFRKPLRRTDTPGSPLDIRLALTAPSHENGQRRHSHEDCKVMKAVSDLEPQEREVC